MQNDEVEKLVESGDDSRRMHLLMLAAALCVIGTMGYTLWRGSGVATRHSYQTDAAMMVRVGLTLAHLWSETHLGGYEFEGIGRARTHLDEAERCVRSLVEGGQTWEGKIAPLRDRDLRQKAGQVAEGLAEFRALMERREALTSTVAADDSQVEQDFEATFGRVLGQIEEIEESLRSLLSKEVAIYRAELAIMILVTTVMAGYAGVFVRGACRRRARMLEVMRDLNRDLQREAAEHAKTQERVAQQNVFLNDVIESLCHPFYVVDSRDLSIVLANSAAKGKGLLDDSACYEASHGRSEPCDGLEHSCPLKMVVQTGQPVTVEHVHRGPEGQVEYVELHGFPVRDESGEKNRVILYSLDVTERKQAERRQTELVGQLETTNAELNDFAHAVSHDLKAPLRAISALASWIVGDYSDRLDEEGKEQLNLLQNRVGRMQKLIDGILTYSRIGRTDQELMCVDLDEHVKDVVDLLGVPESIEVVVADKLPEVVCNENRVRHIFQNLIGNAVKYMGRPEGRITISCRENDGFYEFGVADNGPGIDERHFERIFKVFQTLSPRDESASTGIGLSLVKKSVEACGGRVWVESTVGQGSTFRFTLPIQANEPTGEPLAVGAAG